MKSISLFILCFITAAPVFGHSDAIKPEFVDMILKPYFELQTSLAKDDLPLAKKGAAELNRMLGHGPSHKEAPSLGDLSEEAKKIEAASDLKVARQAFQAISKDLSKMVVHVGTTGKQDVFKMSCPMAFGGKGGEWLQNSDNLANPYFGTMMYTCGSVEKHMAMKNGDGDKSDGDQGRDSHGKNKKNHSQHSH